MGDLAPFPKKISYPFKPPLPAMAAMASSIWSPVITPLNQGILKGVVSMFVDLCLTGLESAV